MNKSKYAVLSIVLALSFASSTSRTIAEPIEADRSSITNTTDFILRAKHGPALRDWLIAGNETGMVVDAQRLSCKKDGDCPAKHTCCVRADGSTLCATACPAD